MSAGISAGAWLIGGAIIASAAVQYESSRDQLKAQRSAQDQAAAQARAQSAQAEQSMNAANKKKPDIGALLAGNMLGTKGGVGGTMLTGPGGVDPSALTLGKSTLLGG